jgi:L-amino acid N-acyltransferase YncA
MLMKWVEDPAEMAAASHGVIDLINLTSAEDGILGYPEVLTPQQGSRFIEQTLDAIQQHGAQVLLCWIEETVSGLLIMRPSEAPNTRHIANLSKCVIHPAYRRGTLFAAGLVTVVERAKALAIEILTLDVRSNTPACRLWQHCGFKTFGILPDYARYRGVSYEGHYLWQHTKDLEGVLASRKWRD